MFVQVSFSDRLLSVVRLSVCLSVCNLFTCSSSYPEPLGQCQPNFAQSFLEWRGFMFVQMKGHAFFQAEIIAKKRKCIDEIFKILFSRNAGPISTKLCPKHTWVKGMQVCSNKGPEPFARGKNFEIMKYIDEIKKNSSQGPLNQPNLTHSFLAWKGFTFVSKEGPRPFTRGDNFEIVKLHWRHL